MRTLSAVMCLAFALAVAGCGDSKKKDGPTPGCGDSSIVAPETCDDGNTDAGDGCTAACQVEPGWTCSLPVSACPVAIFGVLASCLSMLTTTVNDALIVSNCSSVGLPRHIPQGFHQGVLQPPAQTAQADGKGR